MCPGRAFLQTPFDKLRDCLDAISLSSSFPCLGSPLQSFARSNFFFCQCCWKPTPSFFWKAASIELDGRFERCFLRSFSSVVFFHRLFDPYIAGGSLKSLLTSLMDQSGSIFLICTLLELTRLNPSCHCAAIFLRLPPWKSCTVSPSLTQTVR